MPKPPITVLIARSKYPCLLHGGLATGLWVLVMWLMPLWLGVGCACVLGYLVRRQYLAQFKGAAQFSQRGDQLYARWLLPKGELGAEQPVRCDYVGPHLLGLYIGPQRLWLWPDSAPAHSHRALRRLCHRPGR